MDPWRCVIQLGIEQKYGESPDIITVVRPQSVGGNYSPASALKPRLVHTS